MGQSLGAMNVQVTLNNLESYSSAFVYQSMNSRSLAIQLMR